MFYGIKSLEEIFVYQSTLDILWPLLYQQLWLARLSKPGEKDRQRPDNGNMKYDIRGPRNAKEAAQFDR